MTRRSSLVLRQPLEVVVGAGDALCMQADLNSELFGGLALAGAIHAVASACRSRVSVFFGVGGCSSVTLDPLEQPVEAAPHAIDGVGAGHHDAGNLSEAQWHGRKLCERQAEIEVFSFCSKINDMICVVGKDA